MCCFDRFWCGEAYFPDSAEPDSVPFQRVGEQKSLSGIESALVQVSGECLKYQENALIIEGVLIQIKVHTATDLVKELSIRPSLDLSGNLKKAIKGVNLYRYMSEEQKEWKQQLANSR
jgi:hypothetical protein